MPRSPRLTLLVLLVLPGATAAAGKTDGRPPLRLVIGGREPSPAQATTPPRPPQPPHPPAPRRSPETLTIGVYRLTAAHLKVVGARADRLSHDPARAGRWAKAGGKVEVWDGKAWIDVDPQWLDYLAHP